MKIRPEQPDDIEIISNLIREAFSPMPFSSGTEGPIVKNLRKDGDLSLSLVAEIETQIVGYIAFSPLKIGPEFSGLYGLGPLSVIPSHQRKGIGSALIKAGISRLPNPKAICLIGNPDYYGRFGFQGSCGLTYGSLPNAVVQGLFLDGVKRSGELEYAPAFKR